MFRIEQDQKQKLSSTSAKKVMASKFGKLWTYRNCENISQCSITCLKKLNKKYSLWVGT